MLNVLLMATTIIAAIQAIRAKKIINSALWLAGVSALLSILFYLQGACYIAVIELSVGAGLITILFVFAISVAGEEAMDANPLLPRPLAWGLVILVVLLVCWLILPSYPVNSLSSEPAFATVLWEQRGLDVLVQVVLIFSGALGLLGLLAEVKPPLERQMAKEFATQRERELLVMEEQRTASVERILSSIESGTSEKDGRSKPTQTLIRSQDERSNRKDSNADAG
jgi:NADH:ubiquinone oxidoreductase subunit 6 (subunit J)